MIPRFRYWFTTHEKMTYVISIDFIKLEATIQPREIEYIVPIVGKNLMQSTGLFDKNGREIFEGDIIKMRFPRDKRFIGRFKVIKDDISPRLVMIDESLATEKFDIYNYKSDYYEVVGNVFEGDNNDK
nr:MAG TPA: YopX protein [Caudoviricetes sp.]